MKKFILASTILFVSLLLPSSVLSHSGRTDANGGHNCYTGSCAGTYHYHNGGYNPPPVATIRPSTPRPTLKPTTAPTTAPTAEPVVLGISASTTPSASPIVSQTPEPKVEVQGSTATNATMGLLPLGLLILFGPRALKWLARKTAPNEIPTV